jgi:hypothetical protein
MIPVLASLVVHMIVAEFSVMTLVDTPETAGAVVSVGGGGSGGGV